MLVNDVIQSSFMLEIGAFFFYYFKSNRSFYSAFHVFINSLIHLYIHLLEVK